MWKEMQRMHREEGFIYRLADGRIAFRKVPFPEVEIIGEKRRQDVL